MTQEYSPKCQANLDTRQEAVEEGRGTRYNLPIVYFTQLLGLAYGYPGGRMGLRRLIVSPLPLLKKKGLL
jgi:heterodisulfide reductase subunit B